MLKIGILGGGQLGRMLLQEGANYPVETHVMESDENCPAAHMCRYFTKGDIRNYEDVMAFGRGLDAITIEIESVNTEALEALEQMGKTIIPRPSVLKTIKNKILQKEFYKANGIPSPAFLVTQNLQELEERVPFLPAVHKIAEGGYDGKGVQVLRDVSDFSKGFDAPSVLEKMVEIDKEIAITVAISQSGEIVMYTPVEMIFDPYLNLLDYQLCPANLPQNVLWKAEAIAMQLARTFKSAGLFAIEMLVDRNGDVWVNETAPRVHNSGHHTIEAHITSQYDMLWRILLQYPLGSTASLSPSVLINLIGNGNQAGEASYQGLEEVLKLEGAFVHIYGKAQTKPGRKMGHITVLAQDRIDLIRKAKMVKEMIQVLAKGQTY